MDSILRQLKKRRLVLGLKQNDMMMRIGVSRQQYQRLESKGNPTLDTLELIAKGLDSELMLIPKEKLAEVRLVIENNESTTDQQPGTGVQGKHPKDLNEDPWQDLLGSD